MTGNGIRWLAMFVVAAYGVATGHFDIAISLLALLFMIGNWLGDQVLKVAGKQPRMQPATAPPMQTQPVSIDAPATSQNVAGIRLAALHPNQRMHTLIAAKPGDGKTTTANTLLVEDCKRGDTQVYVLNPHFTYFHPVDQPIDLRPLQDRIDVVFDYEAISATLKSLYALVQERMQLYRNGQNVGHPITVYIDEWPAIAGSDYGKECADYLSKLVREARKVNIWLVVCSQDALVDTLKLSGGLRASFHTCLVGNVDATTWRNLTGGMPQQKVQRGTWMVAGTVDGLVTYTPATSAEVARIAQQPQPRFVPVSVAGSSTQPKEDDTLDRVVEYLEEHPDASQSAVERALFGYRGGDAYEKVSKVWAMAREFAGASTTR